MELTIKRCVDFVIHEKKRGSNSPYHIESHVCKKKNFEMKNKFNLHGTQPVKKYIKNKKIYSDDTIYVGSIHEK